MKQTSKDLDVTVDDFLEDLFGLNIRGLKSIWVLFARPAHYFEAARANGWLASYTPSVRLWLSIVAITFFFNFVWAAETSAVVENITLRLQQLQINLHPSVTIEMASNTYARWWFFYLPLTSFAGLFLLASIWPFWPDKQTSFALRARYVYAAVVPSSCITIVTWLGSTWVPMELFMTYVYGTYALAFLLDFLTLSRGLFRPSGSSMWRAFVLAGTIAVISMVASLAAQFAAQFTIRFMYG